MSAFADSFEPLNDVVLIKVDAVPRYSDIIVIPDSVAKNHPMSTGTVVKAGPGRWKAKKAGEPKQVFVNTSARPGQRVTFFAAAMHNKKGSSFYCEMPENHAIIRDGDILFEFDEETKVEV